MKTWKTLTTMALIAAWAITLSLLLPPSGDAATTQTGQGEEWLITGASIQRSQAGACMGNLDVCRERCFYGTGTNEFGCFAH